MSLLLSPVGELVAMLIYNSVTLENNLQGALNRVCRIIKGALEKSLQVMYFRGVSSGSDTPHV